MSRGPSMTALLAVLAIAGYQNRDKIAEMLRGSAQDTPEADKQNGLGGLLGQLGLGGASAGGILSGGLGDSRSASSRAVMATPQSPGLGRGQSSHARRTNLSGRLAPRC